MINHFIFNHKLLIIYNKFINLDSAFDDMDNDGSNDIGPEEFLKWFQANYARMVEKNVRPPLPADEILKMAFGKNLLS